MRFFLFLCAISLSFVSYSQVSQVTNKNQLPDIGVVASGSISIDKELLVGDALMRQLRGQAPIINDPLLEEYIQDLGNRIVANSENVKFPFRFFLIDSKDINAFAFFGGNVGVHTEIIIRAETESELASVLAHEVAHVTQRHIARRIEAQQRFSPIQIATAIAGIVLGVAAGSSDAVLAGVSASGAAAQQNSINYTRSNEQEADRIGIQVMAKAGFDPNGASSFFGKLVEQSRFKSAPPQFLLTHPLPEARVSEARSRAASLPQIYAPPNLNFHLTKMRILARYYRNPEENITLFKKQLKNNQYVFREAHEYALALSYLANEQSDEAEKIIDKLLKKDPENLYYHDAATDILIAQKKFDQAYSALSKQAEQRPRNRVITLNLANVAIENKNYDMAIELLKDYLLVNPDHLLSHQLLSSAYSGSQRFLEMHQTQAEIYALLLAYPRAIDELQHAYNFAKLQNIEKQRIRARIDQFREAQRRLETL
ncbi:M48 family peptidase [Alteromonadaceae bacterium M269]|nr:M48 family peptidase [Alteromonadaceae bacterium M269]